MKKIKIKQNNPISRNNHKELKNQLSFLATNAKINLNQNQILNELIKLKKKQISRNKENLTKFSTINKKIKNKKEISNEVIKEIETNNKEFISLNNYLNKQISDLNEKYISLTNILFNDNSNLNNQLDILKDRQFILENVLKEKDSEIKRLKNYISEIYIQFFDEIKLEIFPEEQFLDSEEEFPKILNIYKDYLLNKCISFNRYKKINNDFKKQITELKTQIKSINKYINTLKNLNTNFDCIDFSNYSKNIYIEGEECLKDKKDKTVNNFNNTEINQNPNLNTEDSFNEISTGIESNNLDIFDFIPNTYFEEKTKLKLKTPLNFKLDLSQINYNKKKKNIEYKEKSLSRKNNYDNDIYSLRIKKLKNKINLCLEKKEFYIDKINQYKQKIKEIKDNIKIIESPPVKSFKIKSIKKRTFLFNSTSILFNNSLSRKKDVDFDGIDNLNRINFSTNRFYK